jgi:hypothetical protein
MSKLPIMIMMASAGIIAWGGHGFFASTSAPRPLVGSNGLVTQGNSGCNIKGNIQVGTGQRIYHMPSQAYYDETMISTAKGERWFCSEAEARAAGWRKARL